jgi:hypothetical protein
LGRIVRTCMEEIDRCRPYFIGFLGGRYGYIPDYVEISKDAYLLSDYPWMEDAILDELSITEMEFRYGGLDEQGKYATGNGMLPHPLFYFKKTIQANEDTPRIAELQNTIAQKGIEVKEFAAIFPMPNKKPNSTEYGLIIEPLPKAAAVLIFPTCSISKPSMSLPILLIWAK